MLANVFVPFKHNKRQPGSCSGFLRGAWGGVGLWGLELGVSAPVRMEDKLSNGLSVKGSPGPASLRLCSGRNFPPVREIEAMAKICPSCHQQGLEESNFKLS